jgi:Flp pilus assembly protein TadG
MFSPVGNAASGGAPGSLLNNDRGAVAVILAVTIIPLVLSMGLAVDLTRSYMAQAKLTAALDTAALAVGADPTMATSKISPLITSYLKTNFPNTNLITVDTPTYSETSTTITVNATAHVKTTFMGLGGFKTVNVSAQSTVSLAKNIEVALVLDNTGSLEDYTDPATGKTNIMALKTAAGHLVVTLFGTVTSNNQQVRVGIVPYVAAVNAGSLASSMVKNPPAYTPGDPTGWTGCLVERASTFAAPLTQTSVATDLDKAVGGSITNYLTQYFWPNHNPTSPWTTATINKGPYTYGNTAAGPNQSCPTPIVPMTSDLQPLLTAIGADTSGNAILNSGMEGWHGGGTIGSIGMSWGYRMLSPNGPLKVAGETVSDWKTLPWQKAVVLMTDGVNNINTNDFTGAPGTPPTIAQVDTQEEAVCDALKAQQVIIYSVILHSTGSVGAALGYCAGQVAGQGDPKYYYVAENQAALYAAFDSIANSLTKLRITR